MAELNLTEINQVAATLGEVCPTKWQFSILCLTILQFLSFFEDVMPPNLQEQILVHIARLLAESDSQP